MQSNILIISDLHLGEDLKPASKTGFLRHVLILERELQSFLEHYASHRLDGHPWRLVVNGDMVDFLAVCLMPKASDEANEEERAYGLGSRERTATMKMERVLERHPGVFRALGRFVAAGNRVEIIVGNHDMEFHWPAVQQTFVAGVGKACGKDVAAGIAFHPWFFFEKDVVYVEHGHQYDEFCSFDYVLNPVAPDNEGMMLSVGAAGARYISNHIEGVDPHQQEDWNAMGYLRWTFMLGARGVARMAHSYAKMTTKMFGVWRRLAIRGAERGRRHDERRHELAASWHMDESKLVELERLKRAPIATSFLRLAGALMVDRVAVLALTALVAGVALVALPHLWALGVIAGAVGGAWLGSRALARTRGETDSHEKLKAIPRRIRELLKAPFVVFGHSHHPVAEPLEGGGMYFNTGTWVPTERPGLLRSFTHVLIRQEKDGPHAALCQWREGKSKPFAAC